MMNTYFGDEERLHQLVINLGANAIRFTPGVWSCG
jgi:signal transduction histidine kinase